MSKLNQRKALAGLLAVCAAMITASPVELAAAGRVSKIRLGTLAPKGSSAYKHLQAMGEQWRKAAGGAVQLTIYPDGTMGGEAEMVRRMRIGQLQAGALTIAGLSEIEPGVAGLQNLPMMFRSLAEADYIRDQLTPALEKRFEEKGFVLLFWADAGWVYFFSKEPILRPDDLRQQKLFSWAGNPHQVDIYKSSGFNPVPLEPVDILSGLQTGLISAVPLPPFLALASQVDSPAPHMLDIPWAPLVGATVISKKTWEAIPASSRAAIKNSALETGKLVRADSRRESEEAITAMKQRGLKVHSITPEIEAEWRRMVEAVYPKIRGTLVPSDIFDLVNRLMADYRSDKAKE